METVLLTGATGFLGSHLLQGLLEDNYRVIVIKRSFSDTWRIEHILDKAISYDLDTVALEEVFNAHRIDAAIHAATTYGKGGSDNAAIIESNLFLPIKLLDLSIAYNVSSFFNTDSFFNTPELNYKYLSSYSLSKKQFVEWLTLLSDRIQVVNLKLEHLYGPRDGKNKFISWLIKECINNASEINLTPGEQRRDFIYVSDAANAFLLILKSRKMLPNYSEYNVGTGKTVSIRDFVIQVRDTVAALSGREIKTSLNFGAIPYIEGEIMESKADNAALKKLGWDYSVYLKDGLERTISDMLHSGGPVQS